MEGAARHAAHVRRRCLPQRDGHHQRTVLAGARSWRPGDRMRLCDPIPDIEDKRDPRTGRRGIDNFASFMKFLAPVARGRRRRIGASRRTGVRRNRLRRMPHAVAANRAERRILSSITVRSRSSRISCCTTSGRATASRRAWRRRRRFARRHSGAFASDGRSCTMGRAATLEEAIGRHANEAELARRGFERAAESDRAALLAFLRSL